MLPIRTNFIFIVVFIIIIPLYGCVSHSVPPAPIEQVSCDYIFGEKQYSVCAARAEAGDPEAAVTIAKLYDDEPFGHIYNSWHKDDDKSAAFYWYKMAADEGHEKALQIVFDSYYFGKYCPQNKSEADRYLKRAADLGHQWAMLVLAYQFEKKEPEKAVELFLKLAREDNCHAQSRLAALYFKGSLIPQDLCKSYFWALLASVGGFDRSSDYHLLAGDTDVSITGRCSQRIDSKYMAENELGPTYVQMVQDAASQWKRGQDGPAFPRIQTVAREKPTNSKNSPPYLSNSQKCQLESRRRLKELHSKQI